MLKNLRTEAAPIEDEEPELSRDEELCFDPLIEEAMVDVFRDILKGLDAHSERQDNILDNWDCYYCRLGSRQVYNGTAQYYAPFIRDAMEARKTRFTNQLFPRSERFVHVISQDATLPHGLMSLLEWYVRKARLRTEVVPALVKHGDAEGQYSIYVSWVENERHVTWKEVLPGIVSGEVEEQVLSDRVHHGYPHVEVLSDADVMIWPVTSTSQEDALSQGGGTVVLRRWNKTTIKQKAAEGEIDEERAEDLLEAMQEDTDNPSRKDPAKIHIDAAGIKKDAKGTYALIYEIWTKLLLPDPDDAEGRRQKRIVRAYMAGETRLLSCRRNPYWSDKLPILSVPKDRAANVVKGKPPVDAVVDFQYAANDTLNMGVDSSHYTLCPIVMTDPEKNPLYGSMIQTMAAVWKCSPQSTQFVEFPPLFQHAEALLALYQRQIFQSLSVSPAQITQGTGPKRKLNQAEVALEQQVDILTTADAVAVLEEGILSPMLERFIELDHQFRDEDVTVPSFGELGAEIKMEKIKPIQFGRHYQFLWYGVEAAKNAQQIQQQIAGINVLRGIPPNLYHGYALNLVPAITNLVENAFGPRLAPQVFRDVRAELSADPVQENKWLSQGLQVSVHKLDNHQQHMQVHQQQLAASGDPSGRLREHIFFHMLAIQEAANPQPQGGQPGTPGGAGPGVPGQPGQPRQGAMPQPPRGGQGPPGMIHADRLQGPGIMPRRGF